MGCFWIINLEEYGRMQDELYLKYKPSIYLGGLMSTFETSIKLAGLYVKTHTQDITNIKQEFSSLNFNI